MKYHLFITDKIQHLLNKCLDHAEKAFKGWIKINKYIILGENDSCSSLQFRAEEKCKAIYSADDTCLNVWGTWLMLGTIILYNSKQYSQDSTKTEGEMMALRFRNYLTLNY